MFCSHRLIIKPASFPSLGREFCGILQDQGNAIGLTDLDQRVWGVLPLHHHGACSDFICPKGYQISPAPTNLSDAEAATLPFSGVLFFNAVETVLDEYTTKGKKILVIGAGGKVGHLATQILIAWGGDVSVIVGQDENDFMKLKVDGLDYEKIYNFDVEEAEEALEKAAAKSGKSGKSDDDNLTPGPLSKINESFDVIINCSQDENSLYPYWEIINNLLINGTYITLNSTLFERADRHWHLNAIINAERDHKKIRKYFKKHKRRAKWANFEDRYADWHLTRLKKLCEEGKVKPAIYKSYNCSDSLTAWKEFVEDDPKIYGKIVVEFDDKAL